MTDQLLPRPPESPDNPNAQHNLDVVVHHGEEVAHKMLYSDDMPEQGENPLGLNDQAKLMTQGDFVRQKQKESAIQSEHERRLHIAESHDNLTGLLNLQGIKTKIEKMMESANERDFGILYIDLNGFKKINDTLGHDVGDELLIKFAAKLDATLRHSNSKPGDEVMQLEREENSTDDNNAIDDTDAARHGGDEFIAIINLKPREEDGVTMSPRRRMQVVENRIREIAAEITTEDERFANFGAAIGSAVWTGGNSEEILREADHQMRADKPENSR